MKANYCPAADELIASPMRPVAFTLPKVLVDAIDKAAVRDDEASPNRSSLVRRALIQFLRRQEAAA
jgi:metal-responsive CopG/Arc/MetJ family transcriptional regulator